MAKLCHVAPIEKYHVEQRNFLELVLRQMFAHMHEVSLHQSKPFYYNYI